MRPFQARKVVHRECRLPALQLRRQWAKDAEECVELLDLREIREPLCAATLPRSENATITALI
jgi:hypothetical protein